MTTSQLCEYTITTNFTLIKRVNFILSQTKMRESTSLPFKGG